MKNVKNVESVKENKMGFVFDNVTNPNYMFLEEGKSFGADFVFSTRHGGVSKYPFDTMNLAFTTNDEMANIVKNRLLFFNYAGLEIREAAYMQQTHNTNIVVAGSEDYGKGVDEYSTGFKDTDGIITDDSSLTAAGCFADCVPVWLFDYKKKAGGIVHAGWKGTGKSIVKFAVDALKFNFNSIPEHIICGIGPSIGPCCFEVDIESDEILKSIVKLI